MAMIFEMARRLRIEFEGALYHVMNRGLDRRLLYKSERDFERFVQNLEASVDRYGVKLHAYALMDNHFHLIIQTPLANLSAFMQGLQTQYGVYFNRKYRRSGHVFQGPYKAELIEEDRYLLLLSRYVHLNPVQTLSFKDNNLKERVQALRAYPWSSYRGYTRLEKRTEWLDYDLLECQVMDRFGKQRGAYRKFVESGLAKTDQEFEQALHAGGLAIGSAEFLEEIKELYRSKQEKGVRKDEDVTFRRVSGRRDPREIRGIVLQELELSEDALEQRRGGGLYRGVMAHMLIKYCAFTQREAAQTLGVKTGAAISMRLKSLDKELLINPMLRKKMKSIERKLA